MAASPRPGNGNGSKRNGETVAEWRGKVWEKLNHLESEQRELNGKVDRFLGRCEDHREALWKAQGKVERDLSVVQAKSGVIGAVAGILAAVGAICGKRWV